ncbi:MAG: response regulator transcription factor [Treponema sp.]|jgi:DNA-binding response OmpR family regulator|nr:response regulator transcription factor [Treponema sp.]
MYNILLVEDNREIQEVNKNMLTRCGGYNIRLANNLAEARERVIEAEPDIIVLDIMLPDGSGLDFLEKLRQDANIPVLLLSALVGPGDVVKGLRAGGDDYLAKPYDNTELLARIESLLRRASCPQKTLTKGRLTLNMISGMAFVDGRDLLFSHKEFALLLLLAQNEGKIISAESLYKEVWGMSMNDNRTLKKHISEIRKKLEDETSGCEIQNVRGEGYYFIRNKEM